MKSNKLKIFALALVIVTQISVLIGMYIGYVYPLWMGREIKIATRPFDPRSLFRGNYARLNFAMNTIDRNLILHSKRKPSINSALYVVLQEDENGLWAPLRYQTTQPQKGVFIRGTITGVTDQVFVRYGIEAFFAPKDKALALEGALWQRSKALPYAVVSVAPSGRALVTDVVVP